MSDAVALTTTPACTNSTSWLASASCAVQSGYADAKTAVQKTLPKIGVAISKGVYGLGYGLSFSVSFPVLLVAKAVPQNNSLVWGLIDGAHAAEDAANRVTAPKTAPIA